MTSPFNIGSSQYRLVGRFDDITLRCYSSNTDSSIEPILIIPSIINKSYILDLLPGRSLIEFFVKSGLSVYMVDWGTAVAKNPYLDLEKIIVTYLDDFINLIQEQSGHEQVRLFGHCLGGTLALIYSTIKPFKIQSLHLITVPVDFSSSGVLGTWASKTPFNLDLFTSAYGKAPAWLLQLTFQLAKPSSCLFKIAKFSKKYHDPEFIKFFFSS